MNNSIGQAAAPRPPHAADSLHQELARDVERIMNLRQEARGFLDKLIGTGVAEPGTRGHGLVESGPVPGESVLNVANRLRCEIELLEQELARVSGAGF